MMSNFSWIVVIVCLIIIKYVFIIPYEDYKKYKDENKGYLDE